MLIHGRSFPFQKLVPKHGGAYYRNFTAFCGSWTLEGGGGGMEEMLTAYSSIWWVVENRKLMNLG